MAAVTELELPRFEYLDPELRGDRFHDTMRELRERSWIAESEFGYFVLDREAAGFFLRSRSAAFPGVQMFELLGITDGPLRDSLSRNILALERRAACAAAQARAPLLHPQGRRPLPARDARVSRAACGRTSRTAGAATSCADFAKPYPARMIATVVGAPLEDAAELHRLSNLLQSQFDAIALMTRREELEQAADEFDAYVQRAGRGAALRVPATTWCPR